MKIAYESRDPGSLKIMLYHSLHVTFLSLIVTIFATSDSWPKLSVLNWKLYKINNGKAYAVRSVT